MAAVVQDKLGRAIDSNTRVLMDTACRLVAKAGFTRSKVGLEVEGNMLPLFWLSMWRAIVGPTWVTFYEKTGKASNPVEAFHSLRTDDPEAVREFASTVASE